MTDQISAAGNLSIELNAERWRLIANEDGQIRPLMEAAPGQPLRYVDIFAAKRRLPPEGSLALDSIQRVVLGWSHEDESWHLGLLLGPEIAQKRGSRWCEIARWPDPDTNVFSDVAAQAGRGLARAISRPFNMIEPSPQEAAPPAAPPALRELPLRLDLWSLEGQPELQLTRSAGWVRGKLLRIVWYLLLIGVYIGLSVMTLQKIIALPKPEFLPYLGLATAVLLAILIVYTLYQLLSRPNAIVVENGGIVARRGGSERWRVNKQDIQSVYVSEIVNKKGGKRMIYHGELTLFLRDGQFQSVLRQPQSVEELDYIKKEDDTQDAVFPLTAHHAHSDLQMAGLYLAQALGVECRYDRRVK